MSEKLEVIITATDQASNVLKGLSGVASGVLAVGAAAATAAVGALAGGLAFSIKEAMSAQEVQAQLAAVLESTGGAAGVTADMANDLASSLSEVTRFEDDAILSGENMLLTFTNIGKDVFPDATKAILDMSTATGQDLQSSAVQLGKALNDPIAGITALTRVGVTFTEEQKEAIKAMVEAGDVAGAQKVILAELQKEFGGSAVAAGETFAGQLDILKNSLGNVAEGVGMALIPILQDFLSNVVMPLVPKIQELATSFTTWLTGLSTSGAVEWFQNLMTTIQTFITTVIVPFVTQHAEEFKGALIAIGAVLAGAAILSGIMAIAGAIAALASPIGIIIAVVAVLGAAWAGNWGGIQEKTMAVVNFLKSLIQTFLANIQAWWSAHAAQIQAIVQTMTAYISAIFAAFKAAFEGDWRAFGENLRVAWDIAWRAIITILGNAWTILRQKVSEIITGIISLFRDTDWGAVGRNIIEGIANGVGRAANLLVNAARRAAEAAWEAITGFFGIDSPSKLMADVGRNMMADMAQGIYGGAAMPALAATQAAAMVTGAAGGSSIQNQYYNLTINNPSGLNRIMDDFALIRALARG